MLIPNISNQMNILQINNFHRIKGGSDFVVEMTTELLREKGHNVILLSRDSKELHGFIGKLKAFAYGLYSPWAMRTIKEYINKFKPDVVHLHEVYPFFAPFCLIACRRAGVPVVMTCHDFRLICPIAISYTDGQICELCSMGNSLWCIARNCRNNFLESVAYSLRHILHRSLNLYYDNITIFIVLSEFAKNKFISYGLSEINTLVMSNPLSYKSSNFPAYLGEYFAYSGRLSVEKGIELLLEAACLNKLPVRLAGDYSLYPDIVKNSPQNINFLGFLNRDEMETFYKNARCLVLPSKWYEMFPLVLLEAMSQGLPIIAPKLGGIPEIVEDGKTGLLFKPGDAEDLARKMTFLWENPDLCRTMGQRGREKALSQYNADIYYLNLISAYEKAIKINRHKIIE